MPRILIVEDQERVAKALGVLLELHGMRRVVARSPVAALACLDAGGFDAVLQDMNFTPGRTGGEEGMELFRALRARHPDLPVLVMTAWSHVDQAVALVRAGAADYVEKPWDDASLIASIERSLGAVSSTGGARQPIRRQTGEDQDLRGLVCASAAMQELVGLVVRVAKADVPVLISGESGTGKERLAEILHANSARRRRAFVRLDVGALPETLLEAELFGAEQGAYTGATRRRQGRFEAADGGTLLLDEIGNLAAAGQAKLLRVLQTGELQRLGSSQSIQVDVRIVAATNTDLKQAIQAGAFREDLYYRLAVIEIDVPPLRRRKEDIEPLAESFLAEAGAGEGRRLSRAARRALREHDWPGNVRELRNRIQRAALLGRGGEIEVADLGLGSGSPRSGPPPQTPQGGDDSVERRRLEAVLVEAGGVVSRAAETLGMSRQALYRRMERLGIVLERRPRS